MRDLPHSSTSLIIQYLEAGLKIPNRKDAHIHTRMFFSLNSTTFGVVVVVVLQTIGSKAF